jgi:hypothetical protein
MKDQRKLNFSKISQAIIARQCCVEGCKHPFSIFDFGINQLELIKSKITGND